MYGTSQGKRGERAGEDERASEPTRGVWGFGRQYAPRGYRLPTLTEAEPNVVVGMLELSTEERQPHGKMDWSFMG